MSIKYFPDNRGRSGKKLIRAFISQKMRFTVSKNSDNSVALKNRVCISRQHPYEYVMIGDFVYGVSVTETSSETIELNNIMRSELGATLGSSVEVTPYTPTEDTTDVEIEITKLVFKKRHLLLREEDLTRFLASCLEGHVLSDRRSFLISLPGHEDFWFSFQIKAVNGNHRFLNQIVNITSSVPEIEIDRGHKLFKNIEVSDLGIGGLDAEIDYIFRRAFVSRTYHEETIKKLGISHVKGIILHGPPGTGKTLISRQLSTMLHCKSLSIVSGPEILDKYVGESEKRVRDLFVKAELDQKSGARGLHVVVFDEIDSICRERGRGGGAGGMAGDNVVNQLLAKMDGVEQLNNILIIGMTNRIDLLDRALLRPGRFEVKVEIKLPDAAGRHRIFQIHMDKMVKNGYVKKFDLDRLVTLTPNFSGAEITGVIKDAVSYALNRNQQGDDAAIEILESDFVKAIGDAQPMFGTKVLSGLELEAGLDLQRYRFRDNIYLVVDPDSERLAKSVASQLDVGNVTVVNNYDLVGLDAYQKSNRIKQAVEQSLICSNSVVVLVRLEEILEYFDFNGHMNIQVAQTVRTILNRHYDQELTFVISVNSDCLEQFLETVKPKNQI
jgi:ATP-dependent 26S proteasome regulatory subunit